MKLILFVLIISVNIFWSQSASIAATKENNEITETSENLAANKRQTPTAKNDQPWDDTWEFPPLPDCKDKGCKNKKGPKDESRQLIVYPYGEGEGYGYGLGYGDLYGYGLGYGDLYGYGYGYGYGDLYGYGLGYGDLYGYGYGDLYGYGYGYGLDYSDLPAYRRNPCRNGIMSLRCRLSMPWGPQGGWGLGMGVFGGFY